MKVPAAVGMGFGKNLERVAILGREESALAGVWRPPGAVLKVAWFSSMEGESTHLSRPLQGCCLQRHPAAVGLGDVQQAGPWAT